MEIQNSSFLTSLCTFTLCLHRNLLGSMTILSPDLCWCFSLALLGATWHIYILGTLSTSFLSDLFLSMYILNSSNTLLHLKSFLLKLYLDYPPRGAEKTGFSEIFLIFMILICWLSVQMFVCMMHMQGPKDNISGVGSLLLPCFKEETLLFLPPWCKTRISPIAVFLSQILVLPLLLLRFVF